MYRPSRHPRAQILGRPVLSLRIATTSKLVEQASPCPNRANAGRANINVETFGHGVTASQKQGLPCHRQAPMGRPGLTADQQQIPVLALKAADNCGLVRRPARWSGSHRPPLRRIKPCAQRRDRGYMADTEPDAELPPQPNSSGGLHRISALRPGLPASGRSRACRQHATRTVMKPTQMLLPVAATRQYPRVIRRPAARRHRACRGRLRCFALCSDLLDRSLEPQRGHQQSQSLADHGIDNLRARAPSHRIA